ncbi:MAG: hypothetical protein RJQ21_02240 [Rhodospirillales bacterium]
MHYSNNKDIARIVRNQVRDGWLFKRGRRHGQLIAPDGRRVIVPCTPSDNRTVLNFLGDIRRNHGSR